MTHQTGRVAWFNNLKGYGFLSYSGAPPVFCHHSAIRRDGYSTLHEGELVEFDVIEGKMGPEAENVVVPKDSSPLTEQ